MVSDTTWRGARGPITDTGPWRWRKFGGEIYDARCEVPGWAEAGFADEAWEAAIPVDVPSIAVVESHVEPTRELQTYPITSFEEVDRGVFQGDAGTCLTGFLELEFDSLKAGQEVVITYSDNAGHARFNRYNQEDRYLARGTGKECFRNRFNYHGFRWVRVEGARPVRGTATLVGTDLKSVTRFRCSSERLNRIHAMVTHTLRCLTLGGVQVDCPHRERLGYGGDGTGVLFELLTSVGRGDLVAAMVDTDDAPGWGNMLARGETATGEDWAGKDSHIHNCFNQVNGWMIRGLVGLQPVSEAPGFRRFRVHPQPGPGITWARAECETAAGTIEVDWRLEGGFSLAVSVPEDSVADVTLPDGSEHTLGGGRHDLGCEL